MSTAYNGYLPPNGYLFGNLSGGDYITSPSGVYYAIEHGSLFWVVPGSNYTVQPCCNGYSPLTQLPTSNTNLGGYFVHVQPGGNLVAYTSATGQDQGTVIPVAASNTEQNDGQAYFAQLNDNGSLQIWQGASPSNKLANQPIYNQANPIGPVTALDLTDVQYDFSKAKLGNVTDIAVAHIPLVNATTTPQQGDGQQNVTYTLSAQYSFSVADAVGESISASYNVGVPGLVKNSFTFGVSNTTTITHGHADTTSTSVTFVAGFRPEVPPLTEYAVDISGVSASYDIPYSWAGIATYQDGHTADVVGTGTFTGASTGNFTATLTCVIAVLPQACPDGGPIPLDLTFAEVPEPGSAAILLAAALATAALRRRRARVVRP